MSFVGACRFFAFENFIINWSKIILIKDNPSRIRKLFMINLTINRLLYPLSTIFKLEKHSLSSPLSFSQSTFPFSKKKRFFHGIARRNLKIYFSIWLFGLSSSSSICSPFAPFIEKCPAHNTRNWYKFHWIKNFKETEKKILEIGKKIAVCARESEFGKIFN